MNFWLKFFLSLLFLLGVITFSSILYIKFSSENKINLTEANENYLKGMSAKTIAEKNTYFNHALDLYLSFKEKHGLTGGNGKLEYNIGNTLFQLNQYPLAIWYYSQATALRPRDEKIKNNLLLAREKLNLPKKKEENGLSNIFFMEHYLSLTERIQLFFVIGVITLFFSSACVWSHRKKYRQGRLVSLVLLAMVLCSLSYTRYFSPLEGILTQSVELKKEKGSQSPNVNQTLVLAGNEVEVISLSSDGEWLKVRTEQGDLGYISYESIRLL